MFVQVPLHSRREGLDRLDLSIAIRCGAPCSRNEVGWPIDEEHVQ